MINFLKVVCSPVIMMFMLSNRTKQKFITSIPDKYHVSMVKYYFSSVPFIAKPIHPDALKILINQYDEKQMPLNNLTYSVLFWNDAICDLVIRDKEYMTFMTHRFYDMINIPVNRQHEMIRVFPDAIDVIRNLSDEMREYHTFIHEL